MSADQPLRVLWLMKGLSIGGAERLLIEIKRKSVSTEYVPIAIGKSDRSLVPELAAAGLSPRVLPSRHEGDIRWIGSLRSLVRALRPDVIHLNNPYVASVARPGLFGCDVPVVYTEHNVWSSYHPISRWGNALTLAANDAIIAVSEQVRESILRSVFGRRVDPKIRVISNGIDVQRVSVDAGKATRRIDLPRPSYGTVGHLRLAKGIDVLLEASKEIRAVLPAARGFVVGEGEDRGILERQRQETGAESVAFLGLLDDARAIMQNLDVFVIAARVEGLPLALLEAMSLGKPIVATTAGGIPDVLTHGHDALLVPVENPRALARAVIDLLSDPKLATHLANNARSSAERFDVRETAHQYERLYRELIHEKA